MNIEPIVDEQEFLESSHGEAVPLPLNPGQAVTARVENLVSYTREVPRGDQLEDVTFVSLVVQDPEAPQQRYMISAGADTVFGQGLLRVFAGEDGFAPAGQRGVRLDPAWKGRLVKLGKLKRSSQSSPHAYHVLVYKPLDPPPA